jgi:hypothetical protein
MLNSRMEICYHWVMNALLETLLLECDHSDILQYRAPHAESRRSQASIVIKELCLVPKVLGSNFKPNLSPMQAPCLRNGFVPHSRRF